MLVLFECSITPDILQHRDELSKFIGEEIARTLTEQKNLERRYEQLIEQRAAMKGMVNKVKYKEIKDEIQEVSRALKDSTNHLVRSLKENPNISGNLIKVQRDRNELNDVLLHCMQEIRDNGRFHSVTHKVDEENSARIRFQQLKTRAKQLEDTVANLSATYEEESRAFKHTTDEQKQAILQLKQELMTKKSDNGLGASFRKRESHAAVSAIWRDYKHQQHQLELKVKALEDKLHIEQIVNNETKDFLQRKLAQLQDTIAQWESKYDKDVGDLDGRIALLTMDRNNLLEKLSTLQARWETDEALDRERKAAMEAEMARKKAEKELLKSQNRAARSIQRSMRSFVKRKKDLEAIKGESKKGKGKGEKGGKKGKKK